MSLSPTKGAHVSTAEFIGSLESIILAGVAMTVEALADTPNDAELTLPMWRVMVVLGRSPEGATVSEVSRGIRVTVPATSRQLRRLAHRGLVDLAIDQRDHRAVRARLSEAGAAFRERILLMRRQRLEAAIADMQVSPVTQLEVANVARLLGSYR